MRRGKGGGEGDERVMGDPVGDDGPENEEGRTQYEGGGGSENQKTRKTGQKIRK